MNEAFLLLGGNQGNREVMLQSAMCKIADKVGDIAGASSVYETAPWGFKTNDTFLNQVIRVNTKLDPNELLATLLNIEKELGRSRSEIKYQSRIIDIDILLYDGLIIHEKDLTIPHPRLHERLFTLVPLAEIAGEHIHPGLGKNINALLNACEDNSDVSLYQKKQGNVNVKNEV